MTVTQHIMNPRNRPLAVRLEPWAEEYSVPAAATLVLEFEGPPTAPVFEITWTDDQVTFGCAWAGARCTLSIDGEEVTPN